MLTVFKYPVPMVDYPVIDMPEGSRIISFQCQPSKHQIFTTPFIWSIVDTDKPVRPIHFALYGTGYPLPADIGVYIGTCVVPNSQNVWHLFYKNV